jgi:hypothetical protein
MQRNRNVIKFALVVLFMKLRVMAAAIVGF